MAGNYTITMDRGATFVRDLFWKIAGTPVDLSGYSGYLMVKPDYESEIVLFDLTSENGEISFDSNGGIHLTCAAEETAAVTDGVYVYDFFVKSQTQVMKILSGKWRVNPSIISEEIPDGYFE
jgi:hypothetical protein